MKSSVAQPPVRVEDIRPADVMAGQRAAMQKDIDWLAARKQDFETVPCPACASGSLDALYEKYGMRHVLCRDCGTQYVCPRPTEEMLEAFYAGSENYAYWARHVFPASEQARRERIFRPRAAAAAGLAAERGLRGGTLVEVGAAYGLFCDEARRLGVFSRIVGIEPTPELAQVCRALGIETIEAPYELVALDSPADMIAAFEVIEHLHAPEKFMRWCCGALRPGGILLLTCPNIRGFETIVLGREAGAVDHEHLNLFHPGSLSLLAERTGFAEIDVSTPGHLDFDLVREARRDGRVSDGDLGPFLSRVIAGDYAVEADFQDFLRKANLSSHMMMVARRAV